MLQKKPQSNCDWCLNFTYDEELDENVCIVDLDEDEMCRYLMRDFKDCPYYKPGDDYTIARKQ